MGDLAQPAEALEWVLEKIGAKKAAPKAQAPSFKPAKITPAEKKKELVGKQHVELQLWKTWKSNGMKPKDLDPLLKSFQPLLQSHLNQLKRAEVPTSTIEHTHKKLLVKALKTWNPTGGAALGTWVSHHIGKGSRFVNDNKNIARQPENVWNKIGDYNSVRSNLTEKLGHEPDDQTIHDFVVKTKHRKLGILSLKDIKRLGREQRKGLIANAELDKDHLLGGNYSSRDEELILMIHPELSQAERSVHEYVFGNFFGKPIITSTSALAKKLKMSDTKVSKLKTSIFKKMEPYRTEGT